MNLKDIRKKRGYTQKNVADYLNCSPVVYSRYESGKREPSIEVLLLLSEFFGVTVDYLLGKEAVSGAALTSYEIALITAARNSDERARRDVLDFLKSHQFEN